MAIDDSIKKALSECKSKIRAVLNYTLTGKYKKPCESRMSLQSVTYWNISNIRMTSK